MCVCGGGGNGLCSNSVCIANCLIYKAYTLQRYSTRHFSVAPYITICPSTEIYFGLYSIGAMSAVTGIYLFRLVLSITFFALRYFLP